LNKYVILASRYKPDFIDSMATQKDVIRLFLQSLKTDTTLSETIAKAEKDDIVQPNPYDRRLRGLNQVVRMQRNKVLFAQKEVMKDPTSLDANIKWVWSLICGCKVKQAVEAFTLLEKKKT